MQKILIPTDFSPIADNALNYAIEIADKFKSELFLFHVYSFNKKIDYNWDFPDDEQPYIKNIEQKMNFTERKFAEKITQKGLSIQTKVEEDQIYSLFNRKVTEYGINLIVMGSKGASGLEKIIFGSVAATALEMAKVPVLVVPPEHSFPSFKEIVLATDLNDVSTDILAPLQKLAIKFGAKERLINNCPIWALPVLGNFA
jgi:nucleotide-binding universal stress UspA family protein